MATPVRPPFGTPAPPGKPSWSEAGASARRTAAVSPAASRWLRENAAAIAAYNRSVEDDGCFGDSLRMF